MAWYATKLEVHHALEGVNREIHELEGRIERLRTALGRAQDASARLEHAHRQLCEMSESLNSPSQPDYWSGVRAQDAQAASYDCAKACQEIISAHRARMQCMDEACAAARASLSSKRAEAEELALQLGSWEARQPAKRLAVGLSA